jgi:hypothetical protein
MTLKSLSSDVVSGLYRYLGPSSQHNFVLNLILTPPLFRELYLSNQPIFSVHV